MGDVPNITHKTALLAEVRNLKSAEAMALLRFTDRKSFAEFVKAQGVPHIRLNSRNFIFPEPALRAWMKGRSIGVRDAA